MPGSDNNQAEMLKFDTDIMTKPLQQLLTELWINEEVHLPNEKIYLSTCVVEINNPWIIRLLARTKII